MTDPRDDSYRQRYEAVALTPDEATQATWIAARYADEIRSVGGNLVLTTSRLIFEPLKTKPATKLLGAAMKFFGLAPGAEVVDEVVKWEFLSPWETSLRDIARVESIPGTDRLRVTLHNGESKVFRIAASLWTPRWSRENAATRDRAVVELSAALIKRQ